MQRIFLASGTLVVVFVFVFFFGYRPFFVFMESTKLQILTLFGVGARGTVVKDLASSINFSLLFFCFGAGESGFFAVLPRLQSFVSIWFGKIGRSLRPFSEFTSAKYFSR